MVIIYIKKKRAVHFEDAQLLNYRKKKCWDMFLDEIIKFSSDYGVNGIHLDNGQSWPQILKLDTEEMYRTDSDNTPAYTNK